MILRRSTTLLSLGLASGSAGILAATAGWAQPIPVIGGGATLNDADVFIPTDGNITGTAPDGGPLLNTSDPRAVIFNSTLDDASFSLETDQGNIPAAAIFRTSTLPTIDDGLAIDSANPAATLTGATGNLLGTLSFRAVGPGGATFANIPTTLDFQVDTVGTVSAAEPFTEFQAQGFVLFERGFASDAGAVGVVERETPVTLVQYQPNATPPDVTEPMDDMVLGNFVPADAYAAERAGDSFTAHNLALSFTSGRLDVPPGFALEGADPDIDVAVLTTTTIDDTSRVDAISVFNQPEIIVLPAPTGDPVRPTLFVGAVQVFPVLPVFITVGVFTFNNVPSGVWFDPPMADGFEYEMTPRNVRVGALSRVFPGMSGVGEADDAVFTSISGFPTGVDADDTFIVAVEGTVLGEFSPGDILQFSDYGEMLGDLLVEGGVRKFTISGIDPAVDSADPLAFPLKLDFNTSTASFEMRALEATATADTTQVSERLGE